MRARTTPITASQATESKRTSRSDPSSMPANKQVAHKHSATAAAAASMSSQTPRPSCIVLKSLDADSLQGGLHPAQSKQIKEKRRSKCQTCRQTGPWPIGANRRASARPRLRATRFHVVIDISSHCITKKILLLQQQQYIVEAADSETVFILRSPLLARRLSS